MSRKSVIHLLLSLLLLITQQLSLGHGYTHWQGDAERIVQAGVADTDGDGKPDKPALHDLCGQCAASAQIAFAVAPTPRRFVAPALAFAAPHVTLSAGICRLSPCPFQPRGPPLAG